MITSGRRRFEPRQPRRTFLSLRRVRQNTPATLALASQDLTLAKKFDPESAEPYEMLAKAYLKANRGDDAAVELEAAARLDVHDASLLHILVEPNLPLTTRSMTFSSSPILESR